MSKPPPGFPEPEPTPETATPTATPGHADSGIIFYADDGKPMRSGGSGSSPIVRIVAFSLLAALAAFAIFKFGSPRGNEKFDQAGYPYTFEYPREYERNANIRLRYSSLSLDNSSSIVGDRAIVLVGAVSNLPAPQRGVAGNGAVTGVIEHALTEFARQRGFAAAGPSRAVEVSGMPGLQMDFTGPGAVSAIRYVMFGSQATGYVISCSGPDSPDDFEKACDTVIKTFRVRP